jgi:ABC-2 type transport system permease protein
MDGRHLPSDLDQWWSAFRHQFRFYLHTSRFLALLLIIVISTGAIVGVTIWRGGSSGTGAIFVSDFLLLFGLFGILIGSFMGGDAVAMDFGGGTGYYMLVLPVRRSVLLLGRYAAAFVASAALIVVFYGGILLGSLYHYHTSATIVPAWPFTESLLLALLYACGILSVAFFFSSFFRSSAVAIVATVLILIFGLDVADSISSTLGVTPWYSINYAENALITAIGAPRSIVSPAPVDPASAAVVMFLYFVGFLAISLVIYHFKESKG